jgi:hypothetical protein
VIGLVSSPPAEATTAEVKLSPTAPPSSATGFGTAVAIDGNTVVVGAPGENAAYIYVRQSGAWTLQQKLVGPDNSVFGAAVGLELDTLVVGAPGGPVNGDLGAVYVYVRQSGVWSLQTTLSSPGSAANFGRRLALDEGTLLVGVPPVVISGTPGAAYVFQREGVAWPHRATLSAPGMALWFGSAVALDGPTAVVGQAVDQQGLSGEGFIFRRNGDAWSNVGRVVLPFEQGSPFGHWVAVDGDTAYLGTPFHPKDGRIAGSSLVYGRVGDNWVQKARLESSDLTSADRFGVSVAIDGDTFLASVAWPADAGVFDRDAVYVFVRTGDSSFSERTKLTIPAGDPGGDFGLAFDVDGDTAIVGANATSSGGAAYIFSLAGLVTGPPPCPSGANCDTVMLIDDGGRWARRQQVAAGSTSTEFYFGDPGDVPFSGDWDCDGDETPGLYRQSDGFVYLRNSNTQGIADIRFFFGNPGDLPISGDFNGDGCATVSIYRPSEQRFYVINTLGANDGGLGAAESSFLFGDPGDKPFVGDFNGDGVDTVGLHRESTGLVYFRNSNTTGIADAQFIFGDPGDRIIAGDWNNDGIDTVAVYRPSNGMFYVKLSNTTGVADYQMFAGSYIGATAGRG